jgi:hypothetical protein
MKWILYFPLNTFFTILCYLTNWLVTPFCDERGELHGLLRYWQTWDDSCDVEFFVKEKVPGIFRYDFDKHYQSAREYTPELDKYNRDKGCVIILDDNFTIWERIQRYFCRTLWLYRNNSYGFAFYLFGIDADYTQLNERRKDYKNKDWYEIVTGRGFWCNPWKFTGQIGWISWYLGWKLYGWNGPTRYMIAGRVILRKKEGQ